MRIHPEWHYAPFGEFDSCPACLGSVVSTVVHDRVNYVCTSCGCCWHVLLGYVSLVDPRTCPGCALRGTCIGAAYEACLAGEARRPVLVRG